MFGLKMLYDESKVKDKDRGACCLASANLEYDWEDVSRVLQTE